MKNIELHRNDPNIYPGLLIAVVTGAVGFLINSFSGSPIADPLLIALIIGIIIRSSMGSPTGLRNGFMLAPSIFIPLGIVFYGANNLNFARLTELRTSMLLLVAGIMAAYILVILFVGWKLGQNKRITYLTATGSAICGASAIAITSPALDAEPEDTSISLVAVAISSITAMAIIHPFLGALLGLSSKMYCELSGSVLQFTGMVEFSSRLSLVRNEIPLERMESLSLAIKASRYLGLIVAIPVLASMLKKKLYIPWFLWAFLVAGITGTIMYTKDTVFFQSSISPYIKPLYAISWSIAMGAIGLNVDIKEIMSNRGIKALIMSFAGVLAATATFLAAYYLWMKS